MQWVMKRIEYEVKHLETISYFRRMVRIMVIIRRIMIMEIAIEIMRIIIMLMIEIIKILSGDLMLIITA